MSTASQLRGFARILKNEVHVSDLLQELTDRDPAPWEALIGVVPDAVQRERPLAKLEGRKHVKGYIDLLLETADGEDRAIEVKIAHQFTDDQRERYEASTDGSLFLLGTASDRTLVDPHERWTFLDLVDVFHAWASSLDPRARMLAEWATEVLQGWNKEIAGVFRPDLGSAKLVSLRQKFLAVLASRRIRQELRERHPEWGALASVSSGSSGLALVQGFAFLDDDENRCLIAEVRWSEGLETASFRLGVDFDMEESRAMRAESWKLAKDMDDAIRIDAFQAYLGRARPDLAPMVTCRGKGGRGAPDDDLWLPVVERGFKDDSNPSGVPGNNGKNGTRSNLNPGFVGDGTQRFEASGKLDLAEVDAVDVIDLIDGGLRHLCAHLPHRYSHPMEADVCQ